MDGVFIKYTGDPLQDFTLMRFLDRFVFRNPKKDPLKGKPTGVHSKRNLYKPKGVKSLAPDSKAYLNCHEEAIPIDERFIYKYFREKDAKKAQKGRDDDDDVDSVTSEDFNDFLDKMSGIKEKDLDFSKGVSARDDEEEDDDDELSDSDEDAAEPEFEGDDDGFKSLSDDDEFDEEGFNPGESEEDEGEIEPPAKKKRKAANKGNNDLQSLLASAEQYADMVDEAALDDLNVGGSEAVNVKDKAKKKQLKWEETRHSDKKGKKKWGKNKKFRK